MDTVDDNKIDPSLNNPASPDASNSLNANMDTSANDEIATGHGNVTNSDVDNNSTNNEKSISAGQLSSNETSTVNDNGTTSHTIGNDHSGINKKLYVEISKLSSSISSTIDKINNLLPQVSKKTLLFKSYADHIKSSESVQSFDDFISKNEVEILNDVNQKQPMNSNYMPLPYIPGTRIPEIDLNNQAKSVHDIWNEWNIGHKNKPPLKNLEKKFGTRWRRGRIAKSAQRRKKIIEFIENEFKRHNSIIKDIDSVVNDLENYRNSKHKGLFWLYGNLPQKLYTDGGEPIFKTEKIDIEEDIDVDGVISHQKEHITHENSNDELEEHQEDGKKLLNDASKGEEVKDKQLKTTNQENLENLEEPVGHDVNDKKRSNIMVHARFEEVDVELEDQEDEDEEDDEDMPDMPSAADVAAMAAMSVQGVDDDENDLVNSAALAVAAQHVADQQRRRNAEQKKKPVIDQVVTDPALSKL